MSGHLNVSVSLAFISVVIFAVIAVPGARAQVDGMTIEPKTDRPGADYRSIEMNGPPEQCARRCADEPQCAAFTYVEPGVQGEKARCWLKTRVPDAQPNARTVSGVKQARSWPDNWAQPTFTTRDTVLADLLVRVGDIDNLGFGWPWGFTPFSGRSTPPHAYPFEPEESDPAGTDRIMIGTGYDGSPPEGQDGYSQVAEPAEAIEMTTDLSGIEVETVALQLFLDDFQAPRFGSTYQVTLDGERYPVMEEVLNALNQTGPIGKLVTVEILPGYHDLLEDGRLSLRIDDPTTGAGDGFAIDFVQVLVNPDTFPSTGTLRGRVTHAKTGAPLPGVLVSSALDAVETDQDGRYHLPDVPAGLVVARAAKPGFSSTSEPVDLKAGTEVTVDLQLAPQSETSQIEENLNAEGRVRLRNILFDTGSATIQAESEPTLQAVQRVMQNRSDTRFVIEGHTDSEGGAESNRLLSQKRAEAVKRWLTEHGIEADRLDTAGYGETRPVASNQTDAGRRLNRRVEIAVAE
ncbi:hypothetical protein CRI94_13640 [Longibacter salinarum]|uniref:OmpA-like domain-containing protein n=1 Tax=Longibacter salinarum TaxID=1850348 RepID=A0A2A8CVC7_9BACT|nr:OmpA family protein [Longibacter salinarum]PEN12560.1 hypothetical protein CRI94_13640 [Longibacter salinarum]